MRIICLTLLLVGCAGAAEKDKKQTDSAGGSFEVTLEWDPYPDTKLYNVYVAKAVEPNQKPSYSTLATELDVENTDFPTLKFRTDAYAQLAELVGESVCFYVKAVVDDVESKGSNVSCVDL